MHEKGGTDVALGMSWKYSTKQLHDMLEWFDIWDATKEEARLKAEAEKNRPK